MLLQINLEYGLEYFIEIAYGIIYGILAILTLKKYRETKNRLAIFFFGAFLLLALSGLYGGISGILNLSGFSSLPIIGGKIMEIYETLALLGLFLFLGGLLSLRTKSQ
jgi:hypothetical protein